MVEESEVFILIVGSCTLCLKISIGSLRKKNYTGWLVVEAEQDPIKANPFEYAKIGFKYLNKTAKECGFEDKEKLVHYFLQPHMAI